MHGATIKTHDFIYSTSYTCRILMKPEFPDFGKILKHQISWKSVEWGAESFHAGIQTVDMTKVIVAFRNYANAPLTLILLTWRIWWAPNNDSKWQMGFNSVFNVLKNSIRIELFHRSTCFISSVAALLCHGVMDVVSFMEMFYIVHQ
jgi:hypothetical protein